MSKNQFAFSKINYMIMIAGIATILIGFFIMSIDTETFGFGLFGLTLGPIVVFLGFMTQFVAIFYKSKEADSQQTTK
jgi:hypothetical protein